MRDFLDKAHRTVLSSRIKYLISYLCTIPNRKKPAMDKHDFKMGAPDLKFKYYHKASLFQSTLLAFSGRGTHLPAGDALFALPPEVGKIISIYDNALCFFLLADFFIRFFVRTPNGRSCVTGG